MKPMIEWIDPATWTCLALATAAFVAGIGERRGGLRKAGSALLLLGCAALLASLSVAGLLPVRSAVLRPDGSSDDPRVLSALLAGIAAVAATAPAWRARGTSAMAGVGTTLPGLVLAGLLGSVTLFAGLRSPLGLATIGVGAFAIGTTSTLLPRSLRGPGAAALLVEALGAGIFVVAAALSLHGARASGITVTEDAVADTLGIRVALVGVENPRADLRVVTVDVRTGRDSLRLRPAFVLGAGNEWRSVADGRLFTGPVVLAVRLREERSHAHAIQWIEKRQTLRIGDASVGFDGFRIEKTDSIRMYADLSVTTASGTQKVSPGVIATPQGEVPFAAEARGIGPIAVARFDPDNHRVGLVLPQSPQASQRHRVLLEARQRPALSWSWAGAALVLLACAWSLVERVPAPGPERP